MGRHFIAFVAVALLAVAVINFSSVDARRPSKWARNDDLVDPNAMVDFTVVLHQHNLGMLEKEVLEISNPKSPRYSQWMTTEEIMDMIAPPVQVSEDVETWISTTCNSANLKDSETPEAVVENLRDAVRVKAPARCVAQLFSIKLAVYQHALGHKTIKVHRDTPVRIPREFAAHVAFVSGIADLPVVRAPVKKNEPVVPNPITGEGAATYDYVVPQTARQLYSVPNGAAATSPKSSQAAIEFWPEGAPFFDDMTMFAQQANEKFTNFSKIVGTWSPGNDGESILDVEYLTALAPSASTWYVTITGWQYEYALWLFNTPNPPYVHSISYGWPEQDTCSPVTQANCTGLTNRQYVERANAEFMKVAGLGVSVIACSQDEGAPSEANEDCGLDDSHPLWPIYPGSSPWVTTVSGTTLVQATGPLTPTSPICSSNYVCGSGIQGLEHPCMPNETYYSWTTGGGFSAWAARPAWQDNAVKSYLSSPALIPPTQWFNISGRGYPDISALGSRILTIQGQSIQVTAGTSAATPIIAALVTLLNDARFNAGKRPLGFLNPMLYTMAQTNPNTFKVINAGNNRGTIGAVCKYGYGCWNGWSPVTGLGTPNFARIKDYVLALP